MQKRNGSQADISGPIGIEIKGVRTVDLKMGLYDIEAALTTPIASDKPLEKLQYGTGRLT